VYVGNNGGIFKSSDAGATWIDKSGGGLSITQFYRIGVSAQNPNIVIGGSQDNGTSFLRNNTWRRVIGGDGMDCLINFSNSNYMYGNIQNGNMQRSYNGGLTWVDANSGVGEESRAWAAPFVINHQNPSTLFRATTMIYKTTNHGANWFAISSQIGGASPLTSLAVAPSDSNYLYLSNGTSLYRTTNSGANWNRMTTAPSSISRIAVHPTNPEHLWLTVEGYSANNKVFVSTNAGTTWSNLSAGLPNIPVNCVAVHPNQPLQVYIGTDLGVFVSNTGGGNWINFSQGLPSVIVDDLEIQLGADVLVAGTFGRGVWLSPLEVFNTTGEAKPELPNTVRIHAYPNPFNPVTDLRITVPQRGNLQLAIYDNNGRMVKELANAKHEVGVYFYQFDATELSSGIYFARASMENVTITEKLSLLK
ncbi:MAG: T9SS type A sorting domain-containing protein, partial [bacterium]|nr:T9SS type A sorting domain-containing protein [bacterium]